jgi:hypothetical protein
MDDSPSGRSCSPLAIVVVVVVIGVLVCLLCSGTCEVRETARRAACLNNMKLLGIALHNFHDAHKKFPGSNDLPLLDKPSRSWAGVPLRTPAEPAPGTGVVPYGTNFSWLAKTMPYLEESEGPYPDMVNRRAWDLCEDNPIDPKTGWGTRADLPCHPMFWRTPIMYFRCPSFGSQQYCEANPEAGIATNPYDPKTPYGPAALTNYVALGATHSDRLMGVETNPLAGGTSHPNGVMYPGSRFGINDITDGSSNTFIACETRETTLAAWWEGSTAAVFGLIGKPSFVSETSAEGKTFGSPAEGTKTTLNWGNEEADPVRYYLPAGPQGIAWLHGPSSKHPGLVNHLLGDGSVRSVQDGIDPKTYMHLITRAGGEPVNEYFAQ